VSGSAAAGAAWMQAAGALALLAVAGHCAARLVQASRAAALPDAAGDAAGVLMALGMAAMLSPLGDPIPAVAGEVVFGLVAAGSLARALGTPEPGRRTAWAGHVAGGAAMVLMFAMPAGAAWALVTWTLIACLTSFAAWWALAAVRGVAAVPARGPSPAAVPAPPVTSLCHAVMAGAMASLLLTTVPLPYGAHVISGP
jgi:hypothetical protein